MHRPLVEQPGLGRGGCTIFGLQFGERFVKGIDAGLVLCFCYMVILEASHYNRYQKKAGCTKPFGLFWIGHFTSIVMFRVFHHLQKYFNYRLGPVMRNDTRLRNARFCVYTMIVCKVLAYCGFLILTIIGSIWFVQDGRCLNNLDDSSNEHAEINMAFWLFGSFTGCLMLAIRVYTRQVLEGANRELVQRDNIGQFSLFLWADEDWPRAGRNLTQTELSTIKKSKLRSYDELRSFAKVQVGLSQEFTNGENTMATNDQKAVNDDCAVVNHECELKQDRSEPFQRTCAVCLENIEIGGWYKKLPKCEHCFHATCIDQWLSTRATCPVCREEIFLNESVSERSVGNGINQPTDTDPPNNGESLLLRFTRIMS